LVATAGRFPWRALLGLAQAFFAILSRCAGIDLRCLGAIVEAALRLAVFAEVFVRFADLFEALSDEADLVVVLTVGDLLLVAGTVGLALARRIPVATAEVRGTDARRTHSVALDTPVTELRKLAAVRDHRKRRSVGGAFHHRGVHAETLTGLTHHVDAGVVLTDAVHFSAIGCDARTEAVRVTQDQLVASRVA